MEVSEIQPWSYRHHCSAPLAPTEFSLMRWRMSHDLSSSVIRILPIAMLMFFIYYPSKLKKSELLQSSIATYSIRSR
jgi:hypothetical protein